MALRLLRVKRVGFVMSSICPVYPATADISGHGRHFVAVPIVDTLKPLDHLVVAVWLTIQGARREGLRHLEEV